ncbi:MAG: KpsF/GutQ family sugar-phosphate isomerase [Sphingobacteriales bacterium]|nr:KpsF/GutQ family sugar-phosphate isomerase [Sphingobacteriales bacterium]
MKERDDILSLAKNALKLEIEGIQQVSDSLNIDFVKSVNAILTSKGRVVITGIGKSAIIAQKIVATLNSTGTPALFMHAADAIHGDLGMIQQDDVVICISKSGNTPEIKVLTPLLKQAGNILIGIVGDTNSFLAKQANLVLDTTTAQEACPHNLAPTTSTTAQLAMGDALAVCLLESRAFTSADFARFHPGGALGKRLYLKVGDLAAQNEKPQVTSNTPVKEVLLEITKNRLGAAAVVENSNLVGVITDGDIRRMLEKGQFSETFTAKDIMGKNPKTIDASALAVDALQQMRSLHISQILVLENGVYAGIVHLHDLLKEGII